jgi:hypothetical protein
VIASYPSGCTGGNPITTQSCTYIPPVVTCTSFTYSAWGDCQSNNIQTRSVIASYPSGCTGGNPVLAQSCTYLPPINGVCGTANNKTYSAATTNYGSDTQCSVGTSSNTNFPAAGGSVVWNCFGQNGGSNATCSANRSALTVINGACGTANNKTYPFSATGYGSDTQCSAGISSNTNFPAAGSSISWTCLGQNGGSNATCNANRGVEVLSGTCGTANGKTYPANTTSFGSDTQCAIGTPSNTNFPNQGGSTSWTCLGQNGGSSASCSASRSAQAVDATCGSAARSYAYSETSFSGAFCSTGTANPSNPSFPNQGSSTSWTCLGQNGGANATCTATRTMNQAVNGQCGSSNNGSFVNAPTGNLCVQGDATAVTSDSSNWLWSCNGLNGGSNMQCSATKIILPNPVNGQCGTASKTYTYTENNFTGSFCAQGSVNPANPVFPSQGGSTVWTCVGQNGGNDVTCTASRGANQSVNGQCGSAAKAYAYTETNFSGSFCTAGNASPANPSFPSQGGSTTWTCLGISGGTDAQCIASRGANQAVNGQCGSSNNGSFVNAPTGGYCNTGNFNNFNLNGSTWTWTCTGSNGGSDAQCQAYKTSNAINGQCGSSNGQYLTSIPTGGFCYSGNYTNLNGNGPWYWTCTGSNGGNDVQCVAYRSQTNYQAPNVYAGSSKNVQAGQSVYMDATASDPQGYSLTYSWTCNGGSLSNYYTLNPTYYAPNNSYSTTYTCTLTATNSIGLSSSSTVTIYINNNNNNNQYPNVFAGSNKTVQSSQTVYMDATASDPQGSYLTYNWSCTGGSLSAYQTLNPTYTAPFVSYDTNYTCTLTATNNRGLSSSSSVNILVRAGQNPINYTNLAVTTFNASNIGTSAASLNGRLDGDNGSTATVRFSYGRGDSLNQFTSSVYGKRAGQSFYASVYGLAKAKVYSFRAEATGSNGQTVYGNTLKFMTNPDSPLNFNAYISGQGVNLTWTPALSACYTAIVKKTGGYPTSETDGSVVYFGTGNSYFDADVSQGTTYYYRAWSMGCDQGMYSWSDSTYSKKYVYIPVPVTPNPNPTPTPTPVVIMRTLNLQVLGRNTTTSCSGAFTDVVSANPGDQIEVNITVSSSDKKALENIMLSNILPQKIDSVSNIQIDGVPYNGDVNSTILLGNLTSTQTKKVSFTIKLSPESYFNGATSLSDQVEANGKNIETVRGALNINVNAAAAPEENTNGMASIGLFANGWWSLLWLLIGLIVGLLIFLLIYLIVKKMNEKKDSEAAAAVARDRYFSIQQ